MGLFHRRSKLQIYYDLLKTIHDLYSQHARVKTILKKANINDCKRGNQYLETLEEMGCVKLGKPCFNQTVSLTPKAFGYMGLYSDLQKMLDNESGRLHRPQTIG